MILGKVTGSVWATKKDEQLTGIKFLIVRELDSQFKEKDNHLIAADNLGAGENDIVMIVTGSAARMTDYTKNKPVDAAIVAIVDDLNVAKKKISEKK